MSLTRLTFQVTHATDADTNAERDYLIKELQDKHCIEVVKEYQAGQRLPTEHINHYTTDGRVTLASLAVNQS